MAEYEVEFCDGMILVKVQGDGDSHWARDEAIRKLQAQDGEGNVFFGTSLLNGDELPSSVEAFEDDDE